MVKPLRDKGGEGMMMGRSSLKYGLNMSADLPAQGWIN